MVNNIVSTFYGSKRNFYGETQKKKHQKQQFCFQKSSFLQSFRNKFNNTMDDLMPSSRCRKLYSINRDLY